MKKFLKYFVDNCKVKRIVCVSPRATNNTTNKYNMTTQHSKTQITKENFCRLDSDICGNPRYYLPVYLAPESIARKLGAVKYRGKKYGAGWVFQTYNLQDDCDKINAAQ